MARKSTKTIEREEVTFEKSSGNVYRDLGFPNPEDMGRKSDLVHRIDKLFEMLSALGEDVMITVHSAPESEERRGRVMVAFG